MHNFSLLTAMLQNVKSLTYGQGIIYQQRSSNDRLAAELLHKKVHCEAHDACGKSLYSLTSVDRGTFGLLLACLWHCDLVNTVKVNKMKFFH